MAILGALTGGSVFALVANIVLSYHNFGATYMISSPFECWYISNYQFHPLNIEITRFRWRGRPTGRSWTPFLTSRGCIRSFREGNFEGWCRLGASFTVCGLRGSIFWVVLSWRRSPICIFGHTVDAATMSPSPACSAFQFRHWWCKWPPGFVCSGWKVCCIPYPAGRLRSTCFPQGSCWSRACLYTLWCFTPAANWWWSWLISATHIWLWQCYRPEGCSSCLWSLWLCFYGYSGRWFVPGGLLYRSASSSGSSGSTLAACVRWIRLLFHLSLYFWLGLHSPMIDYALSRRRCEDSWLVWGRNRLGRDEGDSKIAIGNIGLRRHLRLSGYDRGLETSVLKNRSI